MTVVTYTDLRQNLARYMDEAVNDHEPIFVARSRGKGNVVMISEEDYAAMVETEYLLKHPGYGERLLRSIRQAEEGLTEEHELVYPEASPKK
jgi:antitoxin YefM